MFCFCWLVASWLKYFVFLFFFEKSETCFFVFLCLFVCGRLVEILFFCFFFSVFGNCSFAFVLGQCQIPDRLRQ